MSREHLRLATTPASQELPTRNETLQTRLNNLVRQGEDVYSILRPFAQPVRSADRDHLLRYKYVYAAHGDNPGPPIGDYLMIAFGYDHDLTIYRTFERNFAQRFSWRLDHSMPVNEQQYEYTHVTEVPRSGIGAPLLDIEVSLRNFGTPKGQGDTHHAHISHEANDHEAAERYITAFESDLKQAMAAGIKFIRPATAA